MKPKRGLALLAAAIAMAMLLTAASSPQRPARMGYRTGDDWEPSIAADRFGHVYVFWTHYTPNGGRPDPACRRCASPHMDLQVSSDGGATWASPRVPFRSKLRQDDPQIVVDPVDGRTVYAAYMQGSKSSQYVARSTDFGRTWKRVLVEHLQRGTDKDVLAVRGNDVYLVYNAAMKIYASVSHDRGRTWRLRSIVSNTHSRLGWSLPGGGVVASNGDVYFSWEGYTRNGKPSGPVNIFVSKSTNGGRTWSVHRVDVSQAPPICSMCGWAYWGPGTAMAVDANDTLYLLYNANDERFGPNRMYLARSTDGGKTWTRQDVSQAPLGANHAFPGVVASGNGDVRIAWMDDREGHDDGTGDGTARWNVYSRASSDGGASWSPETLLSDYISSYGYEYRTGFNEPYGDYLEMDIDASGRTQVAWGEGPSYSGPGNVWTERI